MADRGQIVGGLLDGPLAFDNAIDPEAARMKGIKSEVAGRAQILVVPDLEAGNMLAKNLTFLAKADAAGIVLGARVPIILTSRAGFRAHAHGILRGCCALRGRTPAQGGAAGGVTIMDTILVVNAGSSSLKFQVFETDGKSGFKRVVKGQMDGIGTRPRLRAQGADDTPLIDQIYGLDTVPDVPGAIRETGAWLARRRQSVGVATREFMEARI